MVSIGDKLKQFGGWLERKELYRDNNSRYKQCHKAAFQIATLGNDNAPNVQKYLDHAKDELYAAANYYKERRDRY